ncbi:LacI family DNA-binding transcriptional regulator [Pseudomonadota bacterium]
MTKTKLQIPQISAKIRLRDVAEHAGVHASTVSRVLNPQTRGMVSKDVAERVTQTAEALGYSPDPIAYSLKTRRTLTIGVLIPDLTNPMFPPIIQSMEQTLGDAGYTAILTNTAKREEREQVLLEKMIARQVDGIVLATSHLDEHLLTICESEQLPVVLVNRVANNKNTSTVAADETHGIGLAVTHLIKKGHTRIAHIAGPQTLSTGYGRLQGFRDTMKNNKVDVDDELIVYCDAFGIDEGRRSLESLLNGGKQFTAVVAGNDMLAVGCYDALKEFDINCPEQISVTGFNDMLFVDKLSPPLTTVRIPLAEMGRQAANLLLQQITDPDYTPQKLLLPTQLIVRGSTAAPSN